MSRSNKKMKELKTGVHLVIISDAKIVDKAVRITFTDGFNKSFEQDYVLDSDKIFVFSKLCSVIGINKNSPYFKKDAIGQRLWIAIKEVHSGDNIDYYIFDTIICGNPEQRPIISGDPIQHPKGIPMGVFIEYNNVATQKNDFSKGLNVDVELKDDLNDEYRLGTNENITPLTPFGLQALLTHEECSLDSKAKILKEAREMIKKVESKEMSSLNQPNKTDWEDF